jgi:hypothetical protein
MKDNKYRLVKVTVMEEFEEDKAKEMSVHEKRIFYMATVTRQLSLHNHIDNEMKRGDCLSNEFINLYRKEIKELDALLVKLDIGSNIIQLDEESK